MGWGYTSACPLSAQACHGVTFTITEMKSSCNLNPNSCEGLKITREVMTKEILTGVNISKSGSFEK
jgi:hypothetical protein